MILSLAQEFKSNIIAKTFLVASLFAFTFSSILGFYNAKIADVRAEESEVDAVGIKIEENPDFLSVGKWYEDQGFGGSPQEIIVDGYKGIKSDRTVYVNVANVDGSDLESFIYMFSYSQDSLAETKEIFGRLMDNMRFNTNLDDNGKCSISALACIDDDECAEGYYCAENGDNKNKCVPESGEYPGCHIDSDCGNGFFCDSEKAKVIRDNQRMVDLGDVASLLEDYKGENGAYPALEAGTYISGMSLSTWPSWGDEFAEALGGELPEDPINALGACVAGFDVNCGGVDDTYDFNVDTCWDEVHKWFADPGCDLPVRTVDNSYGYLYDNEGADSYELCANFESSYYSRGRDCLLD
jgi:hypothetical protein